MLSRRIHQLLLVDQCGRVVGIEVLDDLLTLESRLHPVVLMAGGLGTHLRPLTEDIPKLLHEIGDRPILEDFVLHGFHRFYLCVSSKSGMVEDYFGNGSDSDVDITYVHEEESLDTPAH